MLETLTKSIILPRDSAFVWEQLTQKSNYEQWTKAFDPTSTFEGEFLLDQTIRFIDNKGYGMLAHVSECLPGERLVLTVTGELAENKLLEQSNFIGATETYDLVPCESGTKLTITQQVPTAYAQKMAAMWDTALNILLANCQ